MKKAIYTLMLCLSLSVTVSFGQYVDNKDALTIRGIFPNYQFQFDNELSISDFTTGIQIEYSRHLSEAFNLAIPLNMAAADYPTDGSGQNFRERIYLGLDALLQAKLFDGTHTFNPALYGGLGFNVENFDEFNINLPLGLLVDVKLQEGFYLSPKLEYRVGFSDNRDNLMPGIGFKVLLGEGVPDTDGDGIKDPEDACPNQAGLPALNGCPDSDGDGIADGQDACPNAAGTAAMNGCPDQDGDGVADKDDQCPDVVGLAALNGCPDQDGDGIADKDDECPTEAGTAANNGCPDRDADNDGVVDADDQCPNTPGLPSLNGCPDSDGDGIRDADDQCPNVAGPAATNGCPDTDRDGVADRDDKCPNSPGLASNDGCPELTVEEKEKLEYAAQAIQFETASSVLKAGSIPILDEIADILSRYPDAKASIDGHTDSIGSASTNQSLSERRAKSCYDYLISKGIAPARLSYQGFGETQPIADNRYKAGREKNRRVEFNIQDN